MLKLIDDENKEIKFEDKEKKFPIVNFLLEFLAWVNLSKKQQQKNKNKTPRRLGNSISRMYLLTLKKT